jgi:hypothetical protein
MMSSWQMVTLVAAKVTTHLASHSWPMDNKECDFKSGTTWTARAAAGEVGMSISPSWVLRMVVPLGLRIKMEDELMRRLLTGKSWKKWAVLPVSATTLVVGGDEELVRGPRGGVVCNSAVLIHMPVLKRAKQCLS